MEKKGQIYLTKMIYDNVTNCTNAKWEEGSFYYFL